MCPAPVSFGPPPIDGVMTAFSDTEMVSMDSKYAAPLGVTCKLRIHPGRALEVRWQRSGMPVARRLISTAETMPVVVGEVFDAVEVHREHGAQIVHGNSVSVTHPHRVRVDQKGGVIGVDTADAA